MRQTFLVDTNTDIDNGLEAVKQTRASRGTRERKSEFQMTPLVHTHYFVTKIKTYMDPKVAKAILINNLTNWKIMS